MALPMQPENMPYYCSPRVRHQEGSEDATVDVAADSLLITIVTQERYKPPCLANYPIQFGQFLLLTDTSVRPMYNSEFPALAF
jgi:hypothetical protein